jgi:hypothetical protein
MSDLVLLKSLLAKLETHESGNYRYRPEDYNIPDMTEWMESMQRNGVIVSEYKNITLAIVRAINDEIDIIIACLKDGNTYPVREVDILCDRLHKTEISIVSKNRVSQGDLGVLLDVKKRFMLLLERGLQNGTLIDANERLDALIGKMKSMLTKPS